MLGWERLAAARASMRKALLEPLFLGVVFVQHLDGDRALEHQVAGTEHVRHAAAADALEQLVTVVENCAFFHDVENYIPSLPPPNTKGSK
jgi:hypothetical protein